MNEHNRKYKLSCTDKHKTAINLSRWSIVRSPFSELDKSNIRLEGVPDKHPRLGGGRVIITSPVKQAYIGEDSQTYVVTTSGTVYRLRQLASSILTVDEVKRELIEIINGEKPNEVCD